MGKRIVIIFSVLSVLLFGCKKERSILVYSSIDADLKLNELEAKQVQEFQKKVKSFDIKYTTFPLRKFRGNIESYLTQPVQPDVLTWTSGAALRFFAEKGMILDISDLWRKEGWDRTYSKVFQELSMVDGKSYFLPASYNWWGIYYRPSLFERYGLTPPETWEELMAICDTLIAEGIKPFSIGVKSNPVVTAWFEYLMIRLNGLEFYMRLMDGEVGFYGEPKVIAVFSILKELIEKGYFIEDANLYTREEAMTPIVEGEAAMYLVESSIENRFPGEYRDDLDFFQFPTIDPSLPVGESVPLEGYVIPKGSLYQQEAKKLLAFLGSAKVQEAAFQEAGLQATNRKVSSKYRIKHHEKGMSMIESADFVIQSIERDTLPLMGVRMAESISSFWQGQTDIDLLLLNIESYRQQFFQ